MIAAEWADHTEATLDRTMNTDRRMTTRYFFNNLSCSETRYTRLQEMISRTSKEGHSMDWTGVSMCFNNSAIVRNTDGTNKFVGLLLMGILIESKIIARASIYDVVVDVSHETIIKSAPCGP